METHPIPYHFARKYGVLVAKSGSEAKILHLPETPLTAFTELQRLLQCELTLTEINTQEFQDELTRIYQSGSSIADAARNMESELNLAEVANQLNTNEDLLDSDDDAPIIRLINVLFTEAIQQKASDIHIETYANRIMVRNRIDGILHEVLEIQRNIAPLVISRIKVMAKLDIAEKRVPQDGRIALNIGDHNIDVRVSTLPSNHAERIVLRILDKKSAQLDLRLLGMPARTLSWIEELIAHPHGIILVTGPTGSGKTTSLYAMLTSLNKPSRNILTIEDPIEYDLPGIGQTQVNPKVDMSFARGLRAILRQDPDIVMIGEIRDNETAQIAVQASLTGHLVLSTLHTNTALGALMRLTDMGVEPFLLTSSIVGLIAQRLVRKLCQHCKKPRQITLEEQQIMQISDPLAIIHEPAGCTHCNHSGFRGRTGIYEVISLNDTLRSMIYRNEDMTVMEQYIRTTRPSIQTDGFARVFAGDTSMSEILRVVNSN